jgi:molybdopterin adenylyltransferase
MSYSPQKRRQLAGKCFIPYSQSWNIMKIDVIIASTSRFQKFGTAQKPEDAGDISGRVILDKVEEKGHTSSYQLLPDGIEPIKAAVQNSQADAVIICGGTGLAPLDLTLEAVEPLYEKTMPGFGEIFRIKSLDQVGTRAMLTRASAGIVGGIPVFCMPGSPDAAALGTELIMAEIGHIIKHVRLG